MAKIEEVKTKKVKASKKEIKRKVLLERLAIAGIVSAFILVIIGILVYLYFANWHYGTMLVKAMKSEIEYYDTYGNSFVLNKDKINNYLYKPLKYTFVDFDQDNKMELVTYIADETGYSYYLLFRYNFEEEKVYGYLINDSDFIGLRKDGSVATDGKDGYYKYYDINFNGNEIYFKDLAISRPNDGYYKVYNDEVYKNMFDQFVQDWMKLEAAEWEYDLVN